MKKKKEDKSNDYIVMSGDPSNTVLDEEYAMKLRQEFRDITGWKVEEGTRIWNELTEFSKRYSKQKRDVTEVAFIFKIAAGI
jgi:hypothetical protein